MKKFVYFIHKQKFVFYFCPNLSTFIHIAFMQNIQYKVHKKELSAIIISG